MKKYSSIIELFQTLKSMPVERESEQSLAMIDEDDLAQGIGKKSHFRSSAVVLPVRDSNSDYESNEFKMEKK